MGGTSEQLETGIEHTWTKITVAEWFLMAGRTIVLRGCVTAAIDVVVELFEDVVVVEGEGEASVR